MDCLSSENLKGGVATGTIERKRDPLRIVVSASTHLNRHFTLHFVDRSTD
jgi:hypothetical protein